MARIWLVDDDATYLYFISEALRPLSYELTRLGNGAAVLKRLEDNHEPIPHLILTDVMMPGCDGFTLLQKLREDSRLRRIPVIVLTGKSGMRESFALEPGVVAFLEKTVDLELLRTTVAKALQERGL
jgi:CheY-like chemotaxis protein